MKCQKNRLDLKVGNYIRTTSGKIQKIISLYDTGDVFTNTHSCIKQENIILSSNNIIDLVKVGDYVNGIPVFIDEEGYLCQTRVNADDEVYYETLKVKNIKSIVTKEQFEKISYEVGDNFD